MSNEQDFKVGDKVQIPPYYPIGEIIAIGGYPADLHYCVKFDTGICAYYHKDELKLVDENPYDRRTAFLTELQALLRKYDATICGGLSDMHNDDVIYVSIGDDEIAYRNGEFGVSFASITADNTMDFDKD